METTFYVAPLFWILLLLNLIPSLYWTNTWKFLGYLLWTYLHDATSVIAKIFLTWGFEMTIEKLSRLIAEQIFYLVILRRKI